MKIKKLVALALATTLVLGSTVTVFADNPASGNGTADGTGSSNGHVERKVVSVTLPTSVGTTFDYTADPEDLIGATKPSDGTTGKTKTGTEVTPNNDLIYFHNAAVTADADKDIAAVTEGYSSTSNTVRVTNKSSAAINLTVAATVEANDNNMAIADAASEIATATSTPTVHFDLLTKAKGATSAETTAVTTTEGVSKAEKKDISIAGVPANFELTQTGTGDSGKYEYNVKSDVKDKDWNYVDISLKGACSKATTTATLIPPKFVMTWSWVDPAAGPQVSVSTTGLVTVTGLTAAQNAVSSHALKITTEAGESYWLDDDSSGAWGLANWSSTSGGSLTKQISDEWLAPQKGKTITITLYLTDESTKTASVAIPADSSGSGD